MLTERQRFLLENEIYRIAKNRLSEWDKKAAQTSHTPEFKTWLDDMEDRYSEIPSKKNKKNDETKKPETLKEWSSKKGEIMPLTRRFQSPVVGTNATENRTAISRTSSNCFHERFQGRCCLARMIFATRMPAP